MNPAQLARLQAARRLHNSATVQIVLDEYHALAPTLLRIGQVEAMEREIAELKAALAAQMDVLKAEVAKADAAAEKAKAVRISLQSGKSTAESRAARVEFALEQARAELEQVKATHVANANERLAVAERKIADQAAHLRRLMEVRKQRSKGAECERDGCTDPQYARGLCIRHYQQERRAQASEICPSCGLIRAVGRSGRCRACYLRSVTKGGRNAGGVCNVKPS